MPTFNFSPNELRTLMRFFLAVSAQQEPYIKDPSATEPLSEGDRDLARAIFTSPGAPCLKCHMTGDPGHDLTATAPNFLQAGQRLKPDWTFRWLLDPQRIMPGTAMPSELFKRDGDRWVFNSTLPAGKEEAFAHYSGDHARLLVRYLLSLTPEEQARARTTVPAQIPAPSGTQAGPVASRSGGRPRSTAANRQSAGRVKAKRGSRLQVSQRARQRRLARERRLRLARERWRQAAVSRGRVRDFSP
jgi:hypothetical protein